MAHSRRVAAGILAVLLAPLAGCFGPGLHAGFDAPDSAARLHAAAQAARTEDRSSIPRLIDLLESDDPAERLVAIAALERLTGTRRAYDHAAPRHERREAVAAWRAWGASAPSGGPPEK